MRREDDLGFLADLRTRDLNVTFLTDQFLNPSFQGNLIIRMSICTRPHGNSYVRKPKISGHARMLPEAFHPTNK